MATVSIAWRRDLGSGASTVASNNLTTSIDCICAANSCFSPSTNRSELKVGTTIGNETDDHHPRVPRLTSLSVTLESIASLIFLLFEVPEGRSGLAQWPGRTRDAARMTD